MSKSSQALYDFESMRKKPFKKLRRLAEMAGVPASKVDAAQADHDKIGLVHLIVRYEYGERVYRSVRSQLLNVPTGPMPNPFYRHRAPSAVRYPK